MDGIIHGIIALMLSLSLQFGVSDAVSTEPQQAAQEFLDGITNGDPAVMEMHMDNEYVNFLTNVKGDEDDVKRMNEAIFKNLSYQIEGTKSSGDVAVSKVKITGNDFSKVMKKYDKASYDYILDNLYEDKVTDKKKLNKECFRIYVDQIVKLADKKPSTETEIYIPLQADGYGGWSVILDDEIMEPLMGNLVIPTLNDK